MGEALAAGPRLEVLFHAGGDSVHPLVGRARELGVPMVEVSDEVIRHLTSTVTPQGLVGVAPFVDRPLEDLPAFLGLVAVLCEVRDPGNAGAVLRSADAADSDAVVFTSSSVDVYNPKTVRSSAGSLFHLPVVREVSAADAVEALRERGLSVYAADTDGELDVYAADLTRPTAFLFGNEAWGLPHEVRSLADATVRIPLGSRHRVPVRGGPAAPGKGRLVRFDGVGRRARHPLPAQRSRCGSVDLAQTMARHDGGPARGAIPGDGERRSADEPDPPRGRGRRPDPRGDAGTVSRTDGPRGPGRTDRRGGSWSHRPSFGGGGCRPRDDPRGRKPCGDRVASHGPSRCLVGA